MSNFLVTGGAGFIGGNYLNLMVKKYPADRFVCLDALTYAGHTQTLAPVWREKNFSFVRGDICDREGVFRLFAEESFDYVVHFAAESHVDRSIADPSVFLRTNVMGTQVLLDACRKYGIRRFHHISTDEVYGDLPLKGGRAFTEESPLKPSSPYSASKASADLLVLAYFRTYGLPVTLSRCSNNYGAYQHPEKLIPLSISRLLRGEKVPVYGTGENVRDWLYVEDHCLAVDSIVRGGRDGEIYNIGGRCEKTNIEVVRTLIRALGKDDSSLQFVADRPGHDRRYAIDPKKIERQLGFSPQTDFSDGIRKTLEWYENNGAWLSAVEKRRKESEEIQKNTKKNDHHMV